MTAGRLAAATGGLVEIHGQHDQQRLLDEDWQRDLLDAFGGHAGPRALVAAAVDRWRANRAALAGLTMDPARAPAPAGPAGARGGGDRGGAPPAGRGRRDHAPAGGGAARARRSPRAPPRCARRCWARGAGPGSGSPGRSTTCASLARLDERWGPLADRLAGLEAEVEDVAAEVRALAETVDHDPASLARLEERLGEIHRLLRRYGDDEAAVHRPRRAVGDGDRPPAGPRGGADDRAWPRTPGCCSRWRTRRRSLSILRSGTAAELGAGRVGGPGRARASRRTPSRSRWAAGRPPATTRRSRWTATRSRSTRTGIDTVVFTFRPNPGEPARSLARIASGGELSRVALAVKQVLAEVDETPTLVFDEIDTGIGGRSADPVGPQPVDAGPRAPGAVRDAPAADRRLRGRALPDRQARARRADRDRDRAARPRTEREAELAQMIGGPDGGDASRLSARELLDRAEAWCAGRARRDRGLTGARALPVAPDLDGAIEEYLAYLRVERGCAEATLAAYRADLADFAMSRGAARDWAAGPEVAQRYLAARARRGQARGPGPRAHQPAPARGGHPRLLPVRVRRRAHRRGRRRPPRPAAPAAAPARDAHRGRGGAAARGGGRRASPARPRPDRRRRRGAARPGAPGAPVRGRPARLGGARPGPRGPLARRRVRARHRQGRQGAGRAGGRRGAELARRGTSPGPGPAGWRGGPGTPDGADAAPLFVTARGRRLGRRPGLEDREAGGGGGRAWATASRRTPCATPSRPTSWRAAPTCGSSRSCSDMPVLRRRSCTRISPANASARSTPALTRGHEGGRGTMGYTETLLASGETHRPARPPALVRAHRERQGRDHRAGARGRPGDLRGSGPA